MFRNVLFEFLEVLECSFRISRKSRNSLMTSHRLMTSERDDHWMCWLMCRPIKGCAGWSTDDESPNIEEAGEKRKFKGDHRLRFPMIRKGVQSITQTSSPSDFDDHLTDHIHHLFTTNQGKG